MHSSTLEGFDSIPTLLETLAAIGTAETPAEPINGLIGSLESLFINLAINRPATVPTEKAAKPRKMIPKVSGTKNLSAANFEPTAKPRKKLSLC